nr:enoyl-CoA hydratase-related protein [Sphingobium sp. Sx8-8]
MPVLIERRDGVARITLNRPRAHNAINGALSAALVSAIESAQDSGCIVLTGTDPAFCAGLDLRDLGIAEGQSFSSYYHALTESRVPIIAAVNGPAVTGGFEIALACDFIVASERAMFADTHLRVKVFPGPVLVDLPRRIGMARAREMSLTGNFMDAATALRIGLANHLVPHEQLLPFATELARTIASYNRGMVADMRDDWAVTGTMPIAQARAAHFAFRREKGYRDGSTSDLASVGDEVMRRSRLERAKPEDG